MEGGISTRGEIRNTLPGPSTLFCGGGISTQGEIRHLSQRISWTGILPVSQFKANDRPCPVVHLRKSKPWNTFTTLKILVPTSAEVRTKGQEAVHDAEDSAGPCSVVKLSLNELNLEC